MAPGPGKYIGGKTKIYGTMPTWVKEKMNSIAADRIAQGIPVFPIAVTDPECPINPCDPCNGGELLSRMHRLSVRLLRVLWL